MTVCLGVAGAGRAMELHMEALKKVNIPFKLKTIVARREEQLLKAKKTYGFENISYNFEDLLNDSEIDVIDICTPPYMHEEMIIKAMNKDKHVICEKPLTGYFGMNKDSQEREKNVSKSIMYEKVMESLERIKEAVEKSNANFMYAENFVYSPPIVKAAEIISKKKSRILYMKGEESLKGSSSKVAGEWNKTGGGTLIRTGVHPLSAIIWLKKQESIARGVEIKPSSIIADMGQVTKTLSEYDHRHIMAKPNDVEDNATVILTFSDESKAVIMASDTCLGGSKNYIELYCNDSNINCNLTMHDVMSTYFLDETGLEDVYISEMLPSKIGWNKVFVSDEIIRGYMDEMQDFMESVYYSRKPKSDFNLAYDTIRIVYAAYKSSELGIKVRL